MVRFASKAIDILSIAISSLLLIRFVFKFLNAGKTAPFVLWVYDFSDNLLIPFRGVFPTYSLWKGTTVEIYSLIAAGVYFGAGYLLSMLLDALADNLSLGGRRSKRGMLVQNPLPQSQHQAEITKPRPDPNQYPPLK